MKRRSFLAPIFAAVAAPLTRFFPQPELPAAESSTITLALFDKMREIHGAFSGAGWAHE